ncbi:ATP-binding cassette domain-containing protein [Sulfitobacter sp. F26204]|uniref:ABC transporter ATP-binding protein n=1 Tax=Sulfitobacter sp. F26204 TaxID=2996014 RepID=UPI00225E3D4D|nr:ATP-binding cassette domain-containing protein [Sulfitobacter sp. F26204]MCX7561748.1 ATP-binding cassette domain-containing protein [Sulfitobacter sp. F26204]
MPETQAGVHVAGLRKTFFPGTVQEKTALNGVSFDLAPGEFAIVIGSNGAGKSTTLNAISGELPLDAGTVAIKGRDVTKQPAFKRAGVMSRVFQDPMLGTAASLTIEENLSISARRGATRSFRSGLKKADRDRFRAALEVLGLGLENRMQDQVSLLSGGQRQSLTLIMATINAPDLLLLDEHTAALDPRAAELVVNATLKTVGRQNITTLMITHNMEQAIAHGDRLLMMHEGQVILDLDRAEKAKLTSADLVSRFHDVVSDRMLLN